MNFNKNIINCDMFIALKHWEKDQLLITRPSKDVFKL